MIARLQQPKQAEAQRVGAAGDLGAEDGGFGVEQVGDQLFQGIASHIVVAVSFAAGEVPQRDPVLLKQRKHTPGVPLLPPVDLLENRLAGKFRLLNVL